MINHHNFDFDAASPAGKPTASGDNYNAQDLVRDFQFHQQEIGNVLTDLLGAIPSIINGCFVTQGTGDTLNITAGIAYGKFSVQVPLSLASGVPGTTQDQIITKRIILTAQTNLAIGSAVLDGTTKNYVKLKYAETNGTTRSRTYVAGSYAYERVPSFTITVNTTAPLTDGTEVLLEVFTGVSLGTFVFQSSSSVRLSGQAQIPPINSGNVLINGGMDFDQRQFSGAGGIRSNNAYSLDRWLCRQTSSGVGITVNIQRSNAFTAFPQRPGKFASINAMLRTPISVPTVGVNDFGTVEQRIEGLNFRRIANRKCTLRFWALSKVTGTYCVALQNSASSQSCVMEYSLVADVPKEVTILLPISDFAASASDFTTGIGLKVIFSFYAGTNFKTSPSNVGTWISGNFVATSNQVNNDTSIANTFQLTDVVLIESEAITETIHPTGRTYSQELELCRRYFEKCVPVETVVNPTVGTTLLPEPEYIQYFSGSNINFSTAGQPIGKIRFRRTKRAIPAVSITSLTNTSTVSFAGNGGAYASLAGYTPSVPSEDGFVVIAGATATGGVTRAEFQFYWSADAEL